MIPRQMSDAVIRDIAAFCERAYSLYHRPRYIAPDPLQVVLSATPENREITALLATVFALGRVDGILRAVQGVLDRVSQLDASLVNAITASSPGEIRDVCHGFVYRFFDEQQVAALLIAAGRAIESNGSLERLFAKHARESAGGESDVRTIAGLDGMVRALRGYAEGALDRSILLALPERGSACKRLLLFLRWMVREDTIDPGGWKVLHPSELLVPVDTHMQSIARAMGVASGQQPSLKSSRRLTAVFREFSPHDPVRYDFSLTRLGIHPDLDKSAFVASEGFTAGADFATFVPSNL